MSFCPCRQRETPFASRWLLSASSFPFCAFTNGTIAAKATDENLTSEDWGAIIEVCDKVSGDPNGSKEAVQSMIKRLAHRNANVQLYTLEVRLVFFSSHPFSPFACARGRHHFPPLATAPRPERQIQEHAD